MIILILPTDEESRALFIDVYKECSNQIYKYAISILKSESGAEDAVQEAFIRLHKSFDTLRSRESRAIKYFLITTTKRICLDMLKQPRELDFDQTPEEAFFGEDLMDVIVTKQILLELIRALGEEDQRLLILRCLHDMTFGEIATVMGISEKYAATKFRRLKARLSSLYMEQTNGKANTISQSGSV